MDECLEATEKIAWMNLRICDKNRRFDEASTVLNNSSSTAGCTADSASTMDSVSLFSALKVDLREGASEMDCFGGLKMVFRWVSWHLSRGKMYRVRWVGQGEALPTDCGKKCMPVCMNEKGATISVCESACEKYCQQIVGRTRLRDAAFGFPSEFPYDFDLFGGSSSSALALPIDSVAGLTATESTNDVDEEFFAELTRRLSQSTLNETPKLTVPTCCARDKSKARNLGISSVLDVAVSQAKVADVDWNLGNENSAIDEFQEAVDMLETLTLKSEASGLEQRDNSFVAHLNNKVRIPR
ncbi:protein NCA1-like [Senna tora]|uniref:Protein NCA1-like n=1 Tax=Senna tora TaxID=362788 RepID=A0A834T127_9FABA|nr:protein NCA1-like [Senna tora]